MTDCLKYGNGLIIYLPKMMAEELALFLSEEKTGNFKINILKGEIQSFEKFEHCRVTKLN